MIDLSKWPILLQLWVENPVKLVGNSNAMMKMRAIMEIEVVGKVGAAGEAVDICCAKKVITCIHTIRRHWSWHLQPSGAIMHLP